MRKAQILSNPTHPLALDGRKSVAALLEKMQGISFQGRSLATAYQIWKKMLGDRVMIMMGIGRFAASLDQSRAHSTREFLYLFGKQLAKKAKEDGIVTGAVFPAARLKNPELGKDRARRRHGGRPLRLHHRLADAGHGTFGE